MLAFLINEYEQRWQYKRDSYSMVLDAGIQYLSYLKYGLIWFFNHISTSVGYLLLKPSLLRNSSGTIQAIIPFLSPKVNLITQVEFEPMHYDIIVLHINHYTMKILCSSKVMILLNIPFYADNKSWIKD